jgi:hypothetical protein
MSKKLLPREDARSEMLLDLARYWRNCAAQSNEQWRCDLMRGTAQEFESIAANVIRRTLTIPQSAGH